MAYVTTTEVKQYGGITWASSLDTFIETLISAAEDYIENFCGDYIHGKRVFKAADGEVDTTRYFNGNNETRLYIGDLRTLTTLVVDGVTLAVNTDFYLYPLNAQADANNPKPYEWIELIQPETRLLNANPRMQQHAPYIFDLGQKTISVTGLWGYSETPPEDIKVAVMKLVLGMIKENIGDNDLREVTQETLGEYSASYAKIKDTAHMLGIDALLKAYKRRDRKKVGRVIQVS